MATVVFLPLAPEHGTVLVSRAGFLFPERPCSVAGRGLFPSRSARRRGAVPSLEMAACSRAVAGRSPEENRETIDGAIPRALRAQASLISVAAGYFLTVPLPSGICISTVVVDRPSLQRLALSASGACGRLTVS